MPNDYAKARAARKTPQTHITVEGIDPPDHPDDDPGTPGVAHPAMNGLSYGSKPVINGVSQARGVVDRNVIDDHLPIGPGYKPKQSKT